MSIDLYKDDLAAVRDEDLFKAIEGFVRISEPIENRPREGYLLDYKREWKDGGLNEVAAFANTFGGLLIVGVSDLGGQPEAIAGFESVGEAKTAIASAIASNISPTPPFEIAECVHQRDSTKRVCVIRVRKGTTLHYLLKGDKPIYVRNETESRPANAAQLRALIERTYESSHLESDLQQRIEAWDRKLYVHSTGNQISGTFFSLLILPIRRWRIELDLALENRFRNFVAQAYLPLAANFSKRTDETARDWFQMRWRDDSRQYERCWRINSACELGFVTQTKIDLIPLGSCWSLYDTIADLGFTLKAARSFWSSVSYFGEARISAKLNIQGLRLIRPDGHPKHFLSLVCDPDLAMNGATIVLTDKPAEKAEAETDVNFASLTSFLPEAVASLTNQLLRSMGHSASIDKLRPEIDRIVKGQ